MQPFKLVKVKDTKSAVTAISGNTTSKFIGGGTNLIDLMKMNIENPSTLVDINQLALSEIALVPGGGLLIGALVRNSDLAYDRNIATNYPVLSQALLAGASPQLRNMATTAGNLLQRTRCPYFFDTETPCNKRTPGSGCTALKSYNRMHAVLGTSRACIATHPSDMCVAMVLLDAIVHVEGNDGKRTIAFNDFHLLPGDTPHIENSLKPGELVTGIELPPLPMAKHSTYIKVRDRHSYEFALTSAAVAIDIENNNIRSARIALGGVATKPWRAHEAEQWLAGRPASTDNYNAAAAMALKDAKTYKYNAFKPILASRNIVRAFQKLQEA